MSDTQLHAQDDLLDNLLSDFLDESDQLLTQMNDNLLQLDEWIQSLEEGQDPQCDPELLNEMFRAAHSIKGLSAMLGLDDINTLTHKIENVFDAARNDQLCVNADVVDLVFMGLDRLTALVERLRDPATDPVDCDIVLARIRELLRSAGAEGKKTSQADAERALAAGMDELSASSGPVPPDPFRNLNDEPDISEDYLSIFVDEAERSLDDFSGALMTLEDGSGGNAGELRRLLGTAHKVKGSAASVGLNRAAKLAHLMEDTLEGTVHAGRDLTPGIVDGLLACTGALQQYVADLRTGSANSDHFGDVARRLLPAAVSRAPAAGVSPTQSLSERLEGVLAEIRQRLEAADAKDIASAAGVAPATVERVRSGSNVKVESVRTLATYLDEQTDSYLDEQTDSDRVPAGPATAESPANSSRGVPTDGSDDDLTPPAARGESAAGSEMECDKTVYVGRVDFEPNLCLAGLKAHLIHEKLVHLGDVLECDPPAEQLGDLDDLRSFSFRIQSDQPLEVIQTQLRLGGVQDVTIESVSGSPNLLSSSSDPEVANAAPIDAGSERNGAVSTPDASRSTDPATRRAATPPPDPGQTQPVGQAVPADGGDAPETATVAPAKATEKDSKPRSAEPATRPAETVRVDIERLDQLMDLAGQLVINKAQFGQVGDKLRSVLNCKKSLQALDRVSAELGKISNQDLRIDGAHNNGDLQQIQGQIRRVQSFLEPVQEEVRTISQARDFVRDLTEAIHQLERVSDGIQQGVMDTRMVPVGPLFARFKRVVRDITRANGKQVKLVIHGEKTELDKRMIDELGDPLVHMVRNSADHGIESPDEREAAGKPPLGTVTLDACHRGNSILIRVSDDGKGLDAERIREKCLQKGVLTPADAEKMTPHQIHQMIWEPGLSTAEKVTDVSGRGMGMDIVKSKIEELNGTVDIESTTGVGTTITIKLPLTLAILPSLMVEIAEDVFAMPMEAVVEIVSVGKERLSTVHGQQTALVRGRVVSVVQLSDTLKFHGGSRTATYTDDVVLVILGEPGREIALIVDRVIGEEDVVIKSIAENYQNVQGIAGASILGDGRVSLILDTTALIDAVSHDQIAPHQEALTYA